MNIFGRVFGGLLVLISLGWLASIAGIRPGWMGGNQISSDPKTETTNLSDPAKTSSTPANGKSQVSSFNTGNTGTQKLSAGQSTTGQPEVENDPRAAGNGNKPVDQKSSQPGKDPVPTVTTPPAAPVSAGW